MQDSFTKGNFRPTGKISGSKFCSKTLDCFIAKDEVFKALSLANKKLKITQRIDDGLQYETPWESILTCIEFV